MHFNKLVIILLYILQECWTFTLTITPSTSEIKLTAIYVFSINRYSAFAPPSSSIPQDSYIELTFPIDYNLSRPITCSAT